MILNTPFGDIDVSSQPEQSKLEAVERALQWCHSMLSESLWVPVINKTSVSLHRTINHHTIEIFPIEAAHMDLGIESRFRSHHLPIHLNDNKVCVQSMESKIRPLHTDMVASIILLFRTDEFNPNLVPSTLHSLLTREQQLSLPRPRRHGQYQPGQPSTSGRLFLPEVQILELFQQYPTSMFRVQFEKRDGTLRDMNARIDLFNEQHDVERNHESGHGLRYDPATYHLQSVIDVDIEEYRLVATDRITTITIEDQTFSTTSAE
jgi:hypothetical protein